MESEIQYLSRRAEEEHDKAQHASDVAAYRIHTEFAREYERRVMALLAAGSVSESSGDEGPGGEACDQGGAENLDRR